MAPRSIPPGRFHDLLGAATQVFIRQGFRRTQMSDIASVMGVAKGTLYLYVESKNALFDATLRHADRQGPAELPAKLPVSTPEPGATLAWVQKRVEEEAASLSALRAAYEQRGVVDALAELEAVVGELYDTLASNRTAIELIDRCAADQPELAAVWFNAGRAAPLLLLTEILERRMRSGHLRPYPDAAVTARIVIETVTFWAVHRYWDPAPQAMDEETARSCVLQFVLSALSKE